MTITRWVWGYLYWGIAWLGIGFLVAELAGWSKVAPWPTLSDTGWHAIRTYPLVGPGIFATVIFLCVHFIYHRPLLQAVGYGVVVALAAHWLDARL